MLELLLLVSFLGTCGSVFYILATHVGEPKSSISLHVAANNRAHAIFALGHFIGGLAFLLFMYRYFYVVSGSTYLFILACFGFMAEQVQALLPNKAKFEKVHTVAALLMGLFISAIIISAPFVVTLKFLGMVVYLTLGAVLLCSAIYALRNRNIFYKVQLLFFCSFYVFLLLLVHATERLT